MPPEPLKAWNIFVVTIYNNDAESRNPRGLWNDAHYLNTILQAPLYNFQSMEDIHIMAFVNNWKGDIAYL